MLVSFHCDQVFQHGFAVPIPVAGTVREMPKIYLAPPGDRPRSFHQTVYLLS